MMHAAPQTPYRDERYEFNAPMWHAFPGPGEDGDGPQDLDSVSQYFNDPKATAGGRAALPAIIEPALYDGPSSVAADTQHCLANAALVTPNARQNVVTVRRRTGPNGRSSGLISPQPLKAAKRLRMEPADENAPPAGTPAAAAKKHKASNIRTSWGGAAATGKRRVHAGPAAGARGQASGAPGKQPQGGAPAPWPPPPKRDALRRLGSPRSRGATAAAAAAAAGTAAADAAVAKTTPPGSDGRTRNQRVAAAAAAASSAGLGHARFSPVHAAWPAGKATGAAEADAVAQQPAPAQQLGAAGPEQPPQPAKTPHKNPQPSKRSSFSSPPNTLPTPMSEHRDFCHVTRSVANALSPLAAAAATAAAGVTPPAATQSASGPSPTAAPTRSRKRSLRSQGVGSPTPGEPAEDIVKPADAVEPEAAAAACGQPVADVSSAAPAAADSEGVSQPQAKRRFRPHKSGLHAHAAARIPPPAASDSVGLLSASVIAVGAAAAVVSAQAAHSAAAAAHSPLPAALRIPATGAFRAAATAAAAAAAVNEVAAVAAAAAVVQRGGDGPGETLAPRATAEAAPLAQPAQQQPQRTAQHRASARLKALTVPHRRDGSPMLHSKLRYRPPNPNMTTEELHLQQARAEAEEAARLRAVNAAAAGRVLCAMPRLPERRPRPTTAGHTPPLATARRPRTRDTAACSQAEEPSVAEQLAAFQAGRGLPGAGASARGSVGPPQLTHPQSPALRTTARLRPSRFVPTEDAEAAAMAAMPPFTALPIRRSLLEGDGGQGVPAVPPRPLTQFAPFNLSETNAPPAEPAAEQAAFVFTARPVPATVQQPALPPRPPRALLTRPQPFAFTTEGRAPRRAAALAAEQAARKALTSSRVKPRASSGAARPQPHRPPTRAASPKLALTSRAAERARFDGERVRRAQQAEDEQHASAAAQATRDAAELAEYRRMLQFKARPVPSADDFAPGPGPVPPQLLTVPQSPYLNTRSRASMRGC